MFDRTGREFGNTGKLLVVILQGGDYQLGSIDYAPRAELGWTHSLALVIYF
jgi:hypothetical protein